MPDDPIRAARLSTLEKLGLTEKRLSGLKVRELTDNQRIKIIGPDLKLASSSITLTPGKPRIGKSHLTFLTPVLVLTEELESNNVALFTSSVPGPTFPSVQIEFPQIKKNKPHLVEFNVSLFEKSKTYKFRVFHFPLAGFQDISLTQTQVITALVPAIPNFSGDLGASIQQRNTVGENIGWSLHSVRVTSVS